MAPCLEGSVPGGVGRSSSSTPQAGEKHIADVKTERGDVLEFQHSPLDPQERRAREEFYQRMVWVVDGTRRSPRRISQLLRAVEEATAISPGAMAAARLLGRMRASAGLAWKRRAGCV